MSCMYIYLHIDIHVSGQYNGNINTYNNNESSYTINVVGNNVKYSVTGNYFAPSKLHT